MMRGQMGKKVHDNVVYRDYNPHQLRLPIDIESFIPADHAVRVVSQSIDQLNRKRQIPHTSRGPSRIRLSL